MSKKSLIEIALVGTLLFGGFKGCGYVIDRMRYLSLADKLESSSLMDIDSEEAKDSKKFREKYWDLLTQNNKLSKQIYEVK